MKATVTIKKSFDDGKKFTKEWETDDFKKFFREEGKYLDELTEILDKHGVEGDDFTVEYTATVTK